MSRSRYGYTSGGRLIVAPKVWMHASALDYYRRERAAGRTRFNDPTLLWRILSEGEIIPQTHCEYILDVGWVSPRRCHSTMTPFKARVWGHVLCFAAPVDESLVTCRA